MEQVFRTVQPPHKSKNITLAQARRAWIEAEAEVREARRRKRTEACRKRAEAEALDNT